VTCGTMALIPLGRPGPGPSAGRPSIPMMRQLLWLPLMLLWLGGLLFRLWWGWPRFKRDEAQPGDETLWGSARLAERRGRADGQLSRRVWRPDSFLHVAALLSAPGAANLHVVGVEQVLVLLLANRLHVVVDLNERARPARIVAQT
jgi:hypothetical protein